MSVPKYTPEFIAELTAMKGIDDIQRKITAKVVHAPIVDLNCIMSIDAVKELTEMLSKDLADSIDKEVVKQLAVMVKRDKRKIAKKIKKRNGKLRKILL